MEWLIFIPLLLFSVIFHEVSHGLVALYEGDDTAYMAGRLTLNPVPHIDLVGSILFPAICFLSHLPTFGWAKPVPINPNRFHHYRSGVIKVSLAGPASNFLLAMVFLVFFYFFAMKIEVVQRFPYLPIFLSQGILLNLVLAIFNLIPIPPLDGSKILSVILPSELAMRYDAIEPYGFFIMMGLVAFGILGKILYPLVSFSYSFLFSLIGVNG
ncbi:MAG: hypothetical protein A3I11_07355 [Elusimicrobia bacterium RIFCSPLOWO2_02_FULL_39_32]|nr:MAG: hypothetical protein A2034_05725 [Elusimicrobia bacterium GWA2_38_7]OGR81432.1 MAG: hypothetical protein A3B80_05270 [Elusimicrobia bacterium RIFCSPHIGHO2_02_FULL_39_36]OGR92001.1 MAG: hypothetical protein A3I11_07355 [Elusimicrobia bacterium RIFCSPLOWO2_02_FULL_39_32]OGR98708.1 MAG: hypothetical protein A3G85_05075 [Elusimicrobia bacterium RIFCSPLOWO2_12_FULL_39_28]